MLLHTLLKTQNLVMEHIVTRLASVLFPGRAAKKDPSNFHQSDQMLGSDKTVTGLNQTPNNNAQVALDCRKQMMVVEVNVPTLLARRLGDKCTSRLMTDIRKDIELAANQRLAREAIREAGQYSQNEEIVQLRRALMSANQRLNDQDRLRKCYLKRNLISLFVFPSQWKCRI